MTVQKFKLCTEQGWGGKPFSDAQTQAHRQVHENWMLRAGAALLWRDGEQKGMLAGPSGVPSPPSIAPGNPTRGTPTNEGP